MTQRGERLGERALVLGGSLAGLLAARAVAPHFDEVILVDRAAFDGGPAPRMSAPQTFHLHVLLKGGEQAMEALAPGFLARLEASGSVPLDPGHDFFSASELGVAKPFETPMRVHGQSRWLLEHCLRAQVLEGTGNLTFRTGETVRGLLYNAERGAVEGVRLEGSDGVEDALTGDLVVDASGRGEGAIRWLKALGLEEPPVETVKVSFGYASTVVRLRPDAARSWKAVVVGNLPRDGARGGVLMPIEDGRHICSLGGRAGDYPPDDEAGFLAFAKALPNPELYEALAGAQFEAPISKLIYPANRLRHYEAMAQRPEGFVPVGDALCSFNPTYGQGMSSAALQAKALSEGLAGAGSLQDRLEAYLARAAEVVRLPWRQANYNDFLYPTTEGDRSMFTPEEMTYRTQVQMAALRDDRVREWSAAVQHLLMPFERLLEPDVRERVAAALGA